MIVSIALWIPSVVPSFASTSTYSFKEADDAYSVLYRFLLRRKRPLGVDYGTDDVEYLCGRSNLQVRVIAIPLYRFDDM